MKYLPSTIYTRISRNAFARNGIIEKMIEPGTGRLCNRSFILYMFTYIAPLFEVYLKREHHFDLHGRLYGLQIRVVYFQIITKRDFAVDRI